MKKNKEDNNQERKKESYSTIVFLIIILIIQASATPVYMMIYRRNHIGSNYCNYVTNCRDCEGGICTCDYEYKKEAFTIQCPQNIEE